MLSSSCRCPLHVLQKETVATAPSTATKSNLRAFLGFSVKMSRAILNYLVQCLQNLASPQPCTAAPLSLDGLVSRVESALAGMARPMHHLHQGSEDHARHIISGGFQVCACLQVTVHGVLGAHCHTLSACLSIYMRCIPAEDAALVCLITSSPSLSCITHIWVVSFRQA